MKIRDYATARVRYGYRRIHVLFCNVKAQKSIGNESVVFTALETSTSNFTTQQNDGFDSVNFKYAVSIHVPARGATPSALQQTSSWRCFNPRTREGCDLQHIIY